MISAFAKVEAALLRSNDPDAGLHALEAWADKILSEERYPLRPVTPIVIHSDGEWEPAASFVDAELQKIARAGGAVSSLCEYLGKEEPGSRAALAAKTGELASCARAALAVDDTCNA